MNAIFSSAAALVACSFLISGAAPQLSAQTLLDQIARDSSSVAAEHALESRGAEDANARQILADRIPLLLSQTKNVKAIALFAKWAGALKLVSAVPALSELLTDDRNKAMSTTLYQTEELIDDPVGAALVQIRDPSVYQVAAQLQSTDLKVRSRAVRVLTKIGTPNAVKALRDASKGEGTRDPRLDAGQQLPRPTPALR